MLRPLTTGSPLRGPHTRGVGAGISETGQETTQLGPLSLPLSIKPSSRAFQGIPRLGQGKTGTHEGLQERRVQLSLLTLALCDLQPGPDLSVS